MIAYKRKLILNKQQQSKIEGWIGVCRLVYNLGLEVKIWAWRNKQVNLTEYDLVNQLTELREIEWIKEVPRAALESTIKRLDLSYKKFFKGSGFPKWANKKSFKSVTIRQNCGAIKIHNSNYIQLPKVGLLKIFKDSEISGSIKTVTIKREPKGYFIYINTDAVKDIQNKDENQVIGLDMGITHFCVDNNGIFIDNPKHFKKYERQLRIENRSLSRKNKGGNSWIKQAKKLALLHHKIGNVRKDFLHKESTKLAKLYHTVYMEDLNISGMVKNRKLSKHISDAGWGIFGDMIAYKTTCITVNAKHTSQQCNQCGHIAKENRKSQSDFECVKCGHKDNADINAGKNIKGRGTSLNRKRGSLERA